MKHGEPGVGLQTWATANIQNPNCNLSVHLDWKLYVWTITQQWYTYTQKIGPKLNLANKNVSWKISKSLSRGGPKGGPRVTTSNWWEVYPTGHTGRCGNPPKLVIMTTTYLEIITVLLNTLYMSSQGLRSSFDLFKQKFMLKLNTRQHHTQINSN